MAKTFRLKSDESFVSAQELFELTRYRASCNRSWYSVMQLITAAVYEDLHEEPGNERTHWSHERSSSLFKNLAKKHRVWPENKILATEIDMMRERRDDTDYDAPTEIHANSNAAIKSIETARKVRAVIMKLLGDKWSTNLSAPIGEDKPK